MSVKKDADETVRKQHHRAGSRGGLNRAQRELKKQEECLQGMFVRHAMVRAVRSAKLGDKNV